MSVIDWKPIGRSEHIVNLILSLAGPYWRAGIELSPSQVFGLLLDDERGLIEDTTKDYGRVTYFLNQGHLAGLIPWSVGADLALRYVGPVDGDHVEVWVDRDDLLMPTAAALVGYHAGALVTRGTLSNSALHKAVERAPRAIFILGQDRDGYESRLTELGFEGDVFEIGYVASERLAPNILSKLIRDEVDGVAHRSEPDDVMVGAFPLRAAMASVGDTTRAVALKRKIEDLIEGAAS